MNIWAKHVDEFVVVAPLVVKELSVIDVPIAIKTCSLFGSKF
jgi:hypothetical protein